MSVCFYITDYGYGHATRTIALIRRMVQRNPRLKVHVKVDFSFDLMRRSLVGLPVEVVRKRNDFGLVNRPGDASVDREETGDALRRWVQGWNAYIEEEKDFCRRNAVGLIISDVPPQPFAVARDLGIPSVAISNFDWAWVYQDLYGDIPEVTQVGEAYHLADLALVLPLNCGMEVFPRRRETGLLYRPFARSRDEVRQALGVSPQDVLVYLGIGGSIDPSFARPVRDVVQRLDAKVLVSARVSLDGAWGIPPGDTETQDYIGACDLVVSKSGYGTMSEAIAARVPMLLFHTFVEGQETVAQVEALGIGKEISREAFLAGEWAQTLENLEMYREAYRHLPAEFLRDGAEDIVGEIVKLAPGVMV